MYSSQNTTLHKVPYSHGREHVGRDALHLSARWVSWQALNSDLASRAMNGCYTVCQRNTKSRNKTTNTNNKLVAGTVYCVAVLGACHFTTCAIMSMLWKSQSSDSSFKEMLNHLQQCHPQSQLWGQSAQGQLQLQQDLLQQQQQGQAQERH